MIELEFETKFIWLQSLGQFLRPSGFQTSVWGMDSMSLNFQFPR